MNRGTFANLIADTYMSIEELSKTKGADYAGDADVAANFKRHAEALGLSKEQVWAVYAGKHWDAVLTYCKLGSVASEPIEGRIDDLILYLLLLKAMHEDQDDTQTTGT